MTVNILVVADSALVREAFVNLLSADNEIHVIGEASTGEEALEKARSLAPHMVLMDLPTQGTDSVAIVRQLVGEVPDVKVILVGAASDEDTFVEAMRAGARGYLSRSNTGTTLLDQIKRTAAGGIALSEAMITKLVNALANKQAVATTSDRSPSAREREVLALLCEGTTNKEIASILVVSENTVRAHVRSLMQKLDAQNRTQLAIYAMHNGMEREKEAYPRLAASAAAKTALLSSPRPANGLLSSLSRTAIPAK